MRAYVSGVAKAVAPSLLLILSFPNSLFPNALFPSFSFFLVGILQPITRDCLLIFLKILGRNNNMRAYVSGVATAVAPSLLRLGQPLECRGVCVCVHARVKI